MKMKMKMKMKTLVFVSLCLTVTLAMPPNHGLTEGNQSPLVGDQVPLQGHVEVEVPAPQAELRPQEQQEKMSPVLEVEDEAKPQVKVERELKEEPEMQVEPELEAKPEVKEEQDVKVDPEMQVEIDIDAKPEVKMEQEVKVDPEMQVEPELEAKPEVKMEQEVKEDPEMQVEPELEAKPEVKAEQEVQEEPQMQVEIDLEAKPEVKVEQEVQEEPEMNIEQVEVKVEQELEAEPEVLAAQELQQEPEMEVEQEVQEEPDVNVEPGLQEAPDFEKEQEHMMEMVLKFRRDMNAGQEAKEEPEVKIKQEPQEELDFEQEQEHMMELELKYRRDVNAQQFQTGQDIEEGSEVEVVPEELDQLAEYGAHAEGLDEPLDDDTVSFPEEENDPADGLLPKVEEPEMMRETFQNEDLVPYMSITDEGPALDSLGQPMLPSESYFPEVESRGEAFSLQDVPPAEEPGRGFVREMQVSTSQGWSCSSGVVLQGKCYQFFREAKKAADAEFFCQRSFSGGHLASITSQSSHMEMMNLMMRHNSRYTRTWIGGLRYLDTGRFIWLDGAEWTYADWLLGEPNHTANVESCVEVLANGKFNDFTCWEPQPFICSFPLQ